jgi:glycosyltransferase involved in cell wall biosynthesis
MKLSVIIPSYKDPLLQKTIHSLLESSELEDQIEIIAVLDGYWPDTALQEDKRVIQLHLGKNRGMRGAINAGVSIARGEFIMRTDEHCIFAKGFDKILTDCCKPNWIVTAKRFFLDPVKWEVMDLPPVEYEKLVIQTVGDAKKFTGFPLERLDRDDVMIDETQAMQGSVWLMPRAWWQKVIVELQTEGYGSHLQDSHEMVFKTWKAGGKLMVNKSTWFAHKHVSFPRMHNYGGKEAEDSVRHSYETWIDYYRQIKPTFQY